MALSAVRMHPERAAVGNQGHGLFSVMLLRKPIMAGRGQLLT
ncbi:hypothetical protein O166_04495 [Pseudogulbenkiania ferrooxidans EGD-HP2]|uniref:Uncharacterized protein n=1 Tax=Pseudogulbenkiania ferrooxidans EGD-HP2 TaxID=1388764 RepID=A0ABN0N8V9_9NEIS|nr:hypothetical protein O166_04495 [Pseudogulbenkiania ferrooxidans EGD-HP2]